MERYSALPDAPIGSLTEDIARVEAITSAVYERSKTSRDVGSDEERQLLDRAESLLPLMKVCMPGDR